MTSSPCKTCKSRDRLPSCADTCKILSDLRHYLISQKQLYDRPCSLGTDSFSTHSVHISEGPSTFV